MKRILFIISLILLIPSTSFAADEVELIDWYSNTCSPCVQMKPIIDQLKTEFKGKATITSINAETEFELAEAQGVTSLPTFHIMKNGSIVGKPITGLQTKETLAAAIQAQLNNTDKPEAETIKDGDDGTSTGTTTTTTTPFEPDLGYDAIKNSLPTSRFSSVGDFITQVAGGFFNNVSIVIGVAALFGIIFAGIMMITAGGDDAKFKKAKLTILYIVIGIVIYVLGFSVLGYLRGAIEKGIPKFNTGTALNTGKTTTGTNATNGISYIQTAPRNIITITNGVPDPATLEVVLGTRVMWQNKGPASAEFTTEQAKTKYAGAVPSARTILKDKTIDQLFGDTGTFAYTITVGNKLMSGKVVIKDNPAIKRATCPTEVHPTKKAVVQVSFGQLLSPGLTVKAGTTVEWYNMDEQQVIFYSDGTSSIAGEFDVTTGLSGATSNTLQSHTFNQVGQYHYYRSDDPRIRGVICVKP
jgi:thioredoxin 1